VTQTRLAHPFGPLRCLALSLVVCGALGSSACLADPQRTQSTLLFGRLVDARQRFLTSSTEESVDEACVIVGDVQTRLVGEPGLTNHPTTYTPLRQAGEALQAVCGQSTVLVLATADTDASNQARQRWQAGIQRELGLACDYLRAAATVLDQPTPC
jgi:hypothetical protein